MIYQTVEDAEKNLMDWSNSEYEYHGYEDVRAFYSGNLTNERIVSEGAYADGRRWFIVDGARSKKTKIYEVKA